MDGGVQDDQEVWNRIDGGSVGVKHISRVVEADVADGADEAEPKTVDVAAMIEKIVFYFNLHHRYCPTTVIIL